MEEEKMSEKVEKLKEFVKQNRPLVISRVPQKTLEAFKNIADEEFCSDYGMCLKFLIDSLAEYGVFVNEFMTRINNHEERIAALEGKKIKNKEIKLLSGRIIKKEEEIRNGQ